MRRWVWRVLLIVAATAALMGTAAAEDTGSVTTPVTVTRNGIIYDLTNTTKGIVVGFSGQVISGVKIETEINNVKITTIQAEAFAGKSGLESIELPEGLAEIGAGAFKTSGLKSVKLPSSLRTLGTGAFESCASLSQITIASGIQTIGERAFAGCGNTGLKSIALPDSVTEIDDSAFESCSSLENVSLPKQVQRIGQKAFNGCSKLKMLYLPGTIQESGIGSNAFSGCFSLKLVHYGGNPTALSTIFPDPDKVAVHAATTATKVGRTPTCSLEGYDIETVSCDTCGKVVYTENRPTSRLPHNEQILNSVAATCTKTGLTQGKWCPDCRTILERQTVVEKTSHTETAMDPVTATCKKPGSTGGKKCSVCGTILVEPTPVEMLTHTSDESHHAAEGKVTREATCTEPGEKTFYDQCLTCSEFVVKRVETIAKTDHNYEEKAYTFREADCERSGISVPRETCTFCGTVKECAECNAIEEALKTASELTPEQKVHLETHGEITVTPALGHSVKKEVDTDDEGYLAATCTAEGHNVYKPAECSKCHQMITPDPEDTDPLGHDWVDPEGVDKNGDIVTVKPTCSTPGEKIVGKKVCSRCKTERSGLIEVIPPTAHTWGDPEEDESKEDVPATCGEPGKSFVIVTCSVCSMTEHQEIEIPATGQHNWGEWTTKEPTETQEGYQVRTCSICKKEDKIVLPATGASSGPDDPDDPDDPDKPDPTYLVNLVQGAGGSVIANTNSAASGARVTLTISASSGYELDMVRVISASGGVPALTELGGGQYRFTMPASNVEVRVTFQRKSTGSAWSSAWASAPGDGSDGNPRRTTDPMPTQNPAQSVPRAGTSGQLFQDIPASHWASGEISWANQMGYMNGSAGRFNPDGTITHQQMWMVLARLTGSRPANMTEARRWAVENSFADGSSPDGAVARHQLVTALYRCAHLMGSSNRNTTSLAGYADSRTVPAVARDAFSWAVANGIVGGTANGRLNPNGTLTRAQFAVILYRYSQRI